jgi:serine/threonine protein kinase
MILFLFFIKAIYFVSDYYAGAKTVESEFLVGQKSIIPEREMWGYISQLVSALKYLHEKNLSCRCLFPSKVLLTSNNRIRISGVGVFDLLNYDPNMTTHYQVFYFLFLFFFLFFYFFYFFLFIIIFLFFYFLKERRFSELG